MKKIIGLIAAVALSAASAFAQVNVSSWNRVCFLPLNWNGNQIVSGEAENWAGTNPGVVAGTTRLFFTGDTKNAGFRMEVYTTSSAGGSAIALGDPNYVYVKPFDWMKVSLGQVNANMGLGHVTFGMFDHGYRVSSSTGDYCENIIFSEMTRCNFDVVLTPIPNLWIEYGGKVVANKEAYHTFLNYAKLSAGYTIPGVGFARAQYIGLPDTTDKKGDTVKVGLIEAAFDLTCVPNLWLSAGVKVPTNFETLNDGNWKLSITQAGAGHIPLRAAIGAQYNLNPFVFHALAIASFMNISDSTDSDGIREFKDVGFAGGLGVDFKINDRYTIITDFRYASAVYNRILQSSVSDAVTTRGTAAGYVGLAQNLSNAIFDVGFQLAGNGAGPFTTTVEDKKFDLTWSVPVQITCWF